MALGFYSTAKGFTQARYDTMLTQLEAFGATLIPILTAAGIELNEPIVARVHNEIRA